MFADLCYRIDKGADHSLRQWLKIGLTEGSLGSTTVL